MSPRAQSTREIIYICSLQTHCYEEKTKWNFKLEEREERPADGFSDADTEEFTDDVAERK